MTPKQTVDMTVGVTAGVTVIYRKKKQNKKNPGNLRNMFQLVQCNLVKSDPCLPTKMLAKPLVHANLVKTAVI